MVVEGEALRRAPEVSQTVQNGAPQYMSSRR